MDRTDGRIEASRGWRRTLAAWVIVAVWAGACSAGSGSSVVTGRGGDGDADDGGPGDGVGSDAGTPPATGGEVSRAACTDGVDNDGDGAGDCEDDGCALWAECGGAAGRDGGTPGGGGECAAIRAEAETTLAPVDIVFAVDSSDSMIEEAELIQTQLNDFAASIGASGVDHRVVMVTREGFVSVPPPLGTDPTRYRFVDQYIHSHEAFQQLLGRWGAYADFLRPDAVTHIVVVTDDESDMDDAEFRRRMEANLGRPFRFHAVASPDVEPTCRRIAGVDRCHTCEGPYGKAVAYGEEYHQLMMRTGGTWFSICSPDWSPLWTALAESVVRSALLPCAFGIPEPPGGETFDRAKVNLVVTRPDGTEEALPRAADPSACTSDDGTPVEAWYYDDPDAPSRIHLCAAACRAVESAPAGSRIDIGLGCETEVVLY